MIAFSIAAREAYRDPAPFLRFKGVFEDKIARKLVTEFPSDSFQDSIGRDERYKLNERVVVDELGEMQIPDLSDSWNVLVSWFVSPGYRELMENLTGACLEGALLKVRLYRYACGDWMRPHADPPDRITTHLIYLTEDWKPHWGGHLNIHRSAAPEDIAWSFFPEFNTSIIFGGTSRPIHSVSKVDPRASSQRCSIIAQFMR